MQSGGDEEAEDAARADGVAWHSPEVFLLAVGWVLAGGVIVLAGAFALVVDRPAGDLTRDAVDVLEAPVYIGVVSNLGALVWTIGVAACLITLLVHGFDRGSPFLWGGLLTALLLADDILLLHEHSLPRVGIPENTAPIVYLAAFSAYVFVFRDFLLSHAGWLLGVAAAFFALSVALDVTLDNDSPFLVEDGFKLLGIVAWTVFFLAAAVGVLRPAPRVDLAAPAS